MGSPTDLGITRGTLPHWVAALDPETTSTLTTARQAPQPARRGAPPGPDRHRPGAGGLGAAELALLRARVAELETENAKLATERDILRQAAKYFAGETRW